MTGECGSAVGHTMTPAEWCEVRLRRKKDPLVISAGVLNAITTLWLFHVEFVSGGTDAIFFPVAYPHFEHLIHVVMAALGAH